MRLSGIYWRRVTGYSHFRVGFVPQTGQVVACMHVVAVCACRRCGPGYSASDSEARLTHQASSVHLPVPSFLLLPSFSLSLSHSFMFWDVERMILPEEWECVWVCVMLTVHVSSVVS